MARSKVAQHRTIKYLPYYRDPMLDDVVAIILNSERKIASIAHEAGVSPATIQAWIDGKTYRPQRFTMGQVLAVLGKKFIIADSNIETLQPRRKK